MSAEIQAACSVREPGDTAWLLSCGVLILTMQGGFALLESGSVRVNNTVNILVKNIFDLALGGVAYWAVGWGFAYGKSAGGFVGTSEFFPDVGLDYSMWFFQLSFAATASTIDSGACCERMHLLVYFGLSFFVTAVTFPVASHWVWNPEGFLSKLGYIDLAGVSVVHVLGGASALVCAKVLGPRLGLLGSKIPAELKCVEKQLELSHRVFAGEAVHVLFGSLLLLFGWVGFNSGSSLGLASGGHLMAGHVAYTTMLGGCFGCCAGSALGAYQDGGKLVPGTIATALLAGLVSVTGASHVIAGWQAALLGTSGSLLAVRSTKLWVRLKIDDPVDVLPVHLVAGVVGTLAPGLFAHDIVCTGVESLDAGLFYGGSMRQLGVQLLGLVAIASWSAFWTWLYLFIVGTVLKIDIRVDPIQEMVGNDVVEHGVDVFQRLKHTNTMQKMMGKLNPARTQSIVQSALSHHSDYENAPKRLQSRKASSVAPSNKKSFVGVGGDDDDEAFKGLTLKKDRSKRKLRRTVTELAKRNPEALSWVSANLTGDTDDDDDDDVSDDRMRSRADGAASSAFSSVASGLATSGAASDASAQAAQPLNIPPE